MAGVTTHGTPAALKNGKWIPIFLRSLGEHAVDTLRREGYLVTIAANGDVGCKACGCYFGPLDVNAKGHFQFHMEELDKYLGVRKTMHTEARKAPPKDRKFPTDEEILWELGLL